uniref:ER membrane protein complex subunit 4 n=1 Tax=Steinernema glaseri TaxID=37863 RepID=A0A1I7ZBI2_9BILA
MAHVNVMLKWRLDLVNVGTRVLPKAVADRLPNPPGYNLNANIQMISGAGHHEHQHKHLLTKRAWDVALQPAKTFPMNLFMLYMAGNAISIFPIMMVAMMMWRPIKALMSVKNTFKPLEEEHIGPLVLHKLVFILGNLAGVALALYKCHGMGLLPNTPSDWLDFLPVPQRMQYSLYSETFA